MTGGLGMTGGSAWMAFGPSAMDLIKDIIASIFSVKEVSRD